ncbi:HD domain-containing protein, partial [Acidihalobacter prosperus]
FSEDPVRVLRVARFAAQFASLGFHIATETLSLMGDMTAAGEVDALVPERLWQELVRALETPSPEVFFETLRQCGALSRLIPELDRLWGVPQPPQWHPEIDTGIHTMLVLKCATQLSPEPSIRFAALMHDVGKGTTPPEEWPRHLGHEKRSEQLIEGICDRLKAPNNFRNLASLTAREHGNVHKVFEMRASSLLGLLEKADALRRPERFRKFLIACQADACGRPGFESHPYPQAEYLIKVLESIRNVPVQPLIKQGFKGSELAQRLRQERIRLIDKLGKIGV